MSTLSTELFAADPAALNHDGAELRLPSGHVVRVDITPDEWADPMDEVGEGTCWGRVEWAEDRYRIGSTVRPEGMDGAARIIDRGHYRALWWQPPADIVRDPAMLASTERRLRAMFAEGLAVATVTVRDRSGAEVDSYSLGALDPFGAYYSADLAPIAADMVRELAYMIREAEHRRLLATAHVVGAGQLARLAR